MVSAGLGRSAKKYGCRYGYDSNDLRFLRSFRKSKAVTLSQLQRLRFEFGLDWWQLQITVAECCDFSHAVVCGWRNGS